MRDKPEPLAREQLQPSLSWLVENFYEEMTEAECREALDILTASLPQCIDRIEASGASRGVEPKEDAHRAGD